MDAGRSIGHILSVDIIDNSHPRLHLLSFENCNIARQLSGEQVVTSAPANANLSPPSLDGFTTGGKHTNISQIFFYTYPGN